VLRNWNQPGDAGSGPDPVDHASYASATSKEQTWRLVAGTSLVRFDPHPSIHAAVEVSLILDSPEVIESDGLPKS
jgi:hypothetical protein